MPVLRNNGSYIHTTWLPRLLVHGPARRPDLDEIDSNFDQVKYNIRDTELTRRCTDDLETQGYDVAVEQMEIVPKDQASELRQKAISYEQASKENERLRFETELLADEKTELLSVIKTQKERSTFCPAWWHQEVYIP